jgi:hypothetical protein
MFCFALRSVVLGHSGEGNSAHFSREQCGGMVGRGLTSELIFGCAAERRGRWSNGIALSFALHFGKIEIVARKESSTTPVETDHVSTTRQTAEDHASTTCQFVFLVHCRRTR